MSPVPADPFRLDGRVAAVTGGGSGIGRAICEVLAWAGASVVVGDIDERTGPETVEMIEQAGGVGAFCPMDVGRPEGYQDMVDLAISRFDRLDILCNLGGPPVPFTELIEVTDDLLDTVLATHLRSVIYGARAAVPHMRRLGGGSIINMSSTAADDPTAKNGLYVLAKDGVRSLTKVLALELGPSNIRVNALAPGVTLTNFSTRHFSTGGHVDPVRQEQWLAQGASRSPLGITGTAEDQAWLALYLAGPAARFVTGQVIRANGGWAI